MFYFDKRMILNKSKIDYHTYTPEYDEKIKFYIIKYFVFIRNIFNCSKDFYKNVN